VGDYFGSQTHVVEHNLKLAEYASRVLLGKDTSDISGSPGQSYIYDALRFPLPAPGAESRQKLDTLIGESDSQPLLAFIPGTTWHTKIWPVEKWIELASLCLSQSGSKIVLIGGPSEREMNAQIASKFAEGVINLTEKTEIADLIGLFSKTALVVGADTGPLHLAAAVGKAPVVAIFGSTPASRNGPYGAQCSSVSLKLECQPCFEKVCPIKTLACLKELAAETVFQQLAPHLLE
jgi:ADP-heptose:LPS heptosyltransferase